MPNSNVEPVEWYEVLKKPECGRVECTQYARFAEFLYAYNTLLAGLRKERVRRLLQITDDKDNPLQSSFELARKYLVYLDEHNAIDTFITVIVRPSNVRGLPTLTLRMYGLSRVHEQSYLNISEVLLETSDTFSSAINSVSRRLGVPLKDSRGNETKDPFGVYAARFEWPQYM